MNRNVAFGEYLGSSAGSLWFSSYYLKTSEIGQITSSGVATASNLVNLSPVPDLFTNVAQGLDGQTY